MKRPCNFDVTVVDNVLAHVLYYFIIFILFYFKRSRYCILLHISFWLSCNRYITCSCHHLRLGVHLLTYLTELHTNNRGKCITLSSEVTTQHKRFSTTCELSVIYSLSVTYGLQTTAINCGTISTKRAEKQVDVQSLQHAIQVKSHSETCK